jgi:hypothetical protein
MELRSTTARTENAEVSGTLSEGTRDAHREEKWEKKTGFHWL